MTKQSAIDKIKCFPNWNLNDGWLKEDEMQELSDMAVAALEKQISKKPIHTRILETSGIHCSVCPICKNPVYADLKNQNHREYCGHCGQAIDWSE